jgi:hypothetical protein
VELVLIGFFLVIDGADGLGLIVLHEIDLGPVVSPLRILTRFVFLHPFAAFFLSVALNFAKIAVFAIPVVVAYSFRSCWLLGLILIGILLIRSCNFLGFVHH